MLESATPLVRRVRQHLRLTQAALAERLKIKQTTISQYETGRAEPSLEVMMRLQHLMPDGGDLYMELSREIAARVQSLSEEERDEMLPIVIRYDEPTFEDLVRSLIGHLRSAQAAPGMLKILRLYLKTGNAQDLWPVFEKAAGYIEVELAQRKRSGR